ncbi:hypothetical protein [Flavobacterium gelatinilyticum]|uniref:hypothetical protein n=1 Tax=Flavobacterium gelatinilyticum TaxID=3003260 RepID=UPI00248041EA|nr:hypothetical protein [Flavobacterium gelatinilyticum]
MIKLYTILFLISVKLIGQTSSEKELVLKYSIGKHNFGEIGQYETKEILKFQENDSFFILTEFQTITNSYVYNSETEKNDLKISDTIIKSVNKRIEKKEIENLVKQLNQNENNFNSDFIDAKLSKKITKKDILKTAKKRGQIFLFVDDETGKLDNFGKEKIKEIQNYKNFEEYLKEINPSINNLVVYFDIWNFVEITYLSSNYKMDFHSVLGQPIRINNSNQIVNLKVNLILSKILPKKSLLTKETALENIKTSYIHWFIKNMEL